MYIHSSVFGFDTVNNISQLVLDDLAPILVTYYPAMLFCIWFGMQDKLCKEEGDTQ